MTRTNKCIGNGETMSTCRDIIDHVNGVEITEMPREENLVVVPPPQKAGGLGEI